MHLTQHDILSSLRQANSRKFNELLSDVAETSDNLTYHLKQLQKGGFITSPSKGEYMLDRQGIIYLNNNLELGHDLFPTVSCMLDLRDTGGARLIMRKLKQPYIGNIHLPTFGVTSACSLHAQIDYFLNRYHITASNIAFQRLYRERTANDEEEPIFDKFFVVFNGTFTSFEKTVDDREFMPMAVSELLDNPQLLPASKAVLSLGSDIVFTESMRSSSS